MKEGHKKTLQQIMGKTVEYLTVEYIISEWEEVDGKIIIATDSTPITIESESVGLFLSGIIVKEPPSSALTVYRPIKLSTMDGNTQKTMIEAMKAMIIEIQEASGKEEVDTVAKKAGAMTGAVRVITEMARLELDLHKAGRM